MIIEKRERGRPKGSTKPEVKVLTPETAEGFMKLRRGQRMQAPIHKARKESAKVLRKALLKLKLQNRYYSEFEEIELNKFGAVLEHPKLKLLGRIFIIGRSRKGSTLEEYYFPERFTEEKRARKIKSIQRKFKKEGVTAHDLRMNKVPEDQISLIFG